MPAFEYHEAEQVGVAAFPLGAQAFVEPEVRLRWGDGESLLFGESNVAVVGHAEITPSFPRVGLALRVSPIAVLDLGARVNATWFFGTFSSLYALPAASTVADEAYQRAAVADRTSGWGLRYDLYARLKGRVGPIVAVVDVEGHYHDLHTFDAPVAWTWEPTDMLVVAGRGWSLHRAATVFAEVVAPPERQDPLLWIGALANWDSSLSSGDQNVRAGLFLAWKPAPGAAVPTVFGGAQAWVESRFAPTFPPYSFLAANWSR
jgi:hypothetical protein